MVHRHPGRAQRDGRLGERRRDERRPRRTQVGQQGESFGGAGQRHHLVAVSTVPLRDRVLRPALVPRTGVTRQIRQPGGQPLYQPVRRSPMAHVDGEVQHAGRDGLVTVIARRRKRARVQTRHP